MRKWTATDSSYWSAPAGVAAAITLGNLLATYRGLAKAMLQSYLNSHCGLTTK